MDALKGQVVVGGVSIQSLEERIRSLEALLGKQTAAPLPATANVRDDEDSAAGPSDLNESTVKPEVASNAKDALPQKIDEVIDLESARVEHADTDAEEETEDRVRPNCPPLFTRMARRHISLETLKQFEVPFEIDHDPEYVIIKRWVPEAEQDFLWGHTKELRADRRVRPRNSSPVTRAEDLYVTSQLEAKTSRLPFEEWKKSTKKGSCVLEVATQSVAGTAVGELVTVPVRLAIHSRHIWRGLRRTTKVDVNKNAFVMLPPWKPLVTYEKEIRKYLEEFEQHARDKKDSDREKEREEDKKIFGSPVKTNPVDEHGGTECTPVLPKPEEKKARFADEKIEIGDKPLPDGTPNTRLAKVFEPCHLCKGEHAKDFDCVSEVISHWRCLIEFIDSDLKQVFTLRKEIAAGTATEIAFADLWHLFSPGDLLITSEPRRAYKVFNTNGGRPCLTNSSNYEKRPRIKPLRVECVYVGFESRGISPAHETIQFTDFSGKLPIKSLPVTFLIRAGNMPVCSVYPAQFVENRSEIITSLIKRGRRVLELVPFSHKYYRGISAVEGDYLEGEVIIDTKSKEVEGTPHAIPLGLFGHVEYDIRELTEGCTHLPPTITQPNPPEFVPACRCWKTIDDFIVDTARSEAYKGDAALLEVRTLSQTDLTDDHLMLMAPHIRGYLLKSNQWWGIYIDLVQDLHVEFKAERRFEDLILPQGHENLLKAIISPSRAQEFAWRADDLASISYMRTKTPQKGLRLLFHGPPGTGKTATAAAIAAFTNRPLYHIRCVNIESGAEGLQQNLRRAQQWNCVVVFYEADIFFARRSARDCYDVEVNSCMSTLMDVIDLYKGILIFCTRRVKTFDESLVSRMHVALHFEELDNERTMRVWRHSLERLYLTGVIDGPLDDGILTFVESQWDAGSRWDARQIRNILETAMAMAPAAEGNGKPQVTLNHVQVVVNAGNSFAEFHKASIQEQEEEDRARWICGGSSADSWINLSRRGTKNAVDDGVDD